MSDQPDPAVAACLLQEITEIIRDSYAPLLEAKDKRIAELEEAIRYWIAVDNIIVNNSPNPESRLAAKARIIAMKSALRKERRQTHEND